MTPTRTAERPPRGTAAAFTLLEVLMAVAVLGVCVTTLLVARNRATTSRIEAVERLDAIEAAAAALGRRLAADEEEVEPLGEVPGRRDWTWSVGEAAVLGETRSGRTLVLYRATVAWPAVDGSIRELPLSTARCEKPE
ncbi:MAG: type II secretion system protein [Planctomycetota bacterium]